MIFKTSRRLRKFFNRELTDEMIWDEILTAGRLEHIFQLTKLNEEVAHSLIKLEKRMQLLSLGITELLPNVAGELVKYQGVKLFLNGVRELSPDTARAIAAFKGGKLALNGLKTINLTQMGRLASYRGILHLDGVETIAFNETERRRAETVFSKLQFSRLSMLGLKKPSSLICYALSQFPGELELDGIEKLAQGEADILANHVGKGLAFRGIKSIGPELIKLLSQYKSMLDLRGAELIDDGALPAVASRSSSITALANPVKRRIEDYSEQMAQEAAELKKAIDAGMNFDQVKPVDNLIVNHTEKLIPEWPVLSQDREGVAADIDILEELGQFDEMKLTPQDAVLPTQAWEFDDLGLFQVDQTLIDDIESGLNQEIINKKKQLHALLLKGFSNLSNPEKERVNFLRTEIENLKEHIRTALDALVQQKELGSVVFNSTEDLAAYLNKLGEDDQNDALSRMDNESFDLLDKSLVEGDVLESDILTVDNDESELSMDESHHFDELIEGEDFVFTGID